MKVHPVFTIGLLLVGCSGDPEGLIVASGAIEATGVTVTAKVGGELLKRLADEGTRVAKGDTVAVIDRSDLELQLRQAAANADGAEAQYQLTVKGPREEDLLQAEATYESARSDLERAGQLFEANSIPKKQFDDSRTRYVVAEQMYRKLQRGSRPEEITMARARYEQARAAADAIRKKIGDTYVVSPVSGVVTQQSVEEGDVVMPNGAVFRITRLDKVHLMIYVTEMELARVQLGQVAEVSIDAYPDRRFQGTVVYISDIAEFTPKNVQTKEDRTKLVFGIKIEVPNGEGILKPGMPADATIHTAAGS